MSLAIICLAVLLLSQPSIVTYAQLLGPPATSRGNCISRCRTQYTGAFEGTQARTDSTTNPQAWCSYWSFECACLSSCQQSVTCVYSRSGSSCSVRKSTHIFEKDRFTQITDYRC